MLQRLDNVAQVTTHDTRIIFSLVKGSIFLIYQMIHLIRGLAIYFALLVNFGVLCLIVCHLEILTE